MPNATLWRALLAVENTVVELVEYDADEQVVIARVRPMARVAGRCGRCGQRAPGYDQGEVETRRWRGLDWGTIRSGWRLRHRR